MNQPVTREENVRNLIYLRFEVMNSLDELEERSSSAFLKFAANSQALRKDLKDLKAFFKRLLNLTSSRATMTLEDLVRSK